MENVKLPPHKQYRNRKLPTNDIENDNINIKIEHNINFGKMFLYEEDENNRSTKYLTESKKRIKWYKRKP